jgi:hypothetical protein
MVSPLYCWSGFATTAVCFSSLLAKAPVVEFVCAARCGRLGLLSGRQFLTRFQDSIVQPASLCWLRSKLKDLCLSVEPISGLLKNLMCSYSSCSSCLWFLTQISLVTDCVCGLLQGKAGVVFKLSDRKARGFIVQIALLRCFSERVHQGLGEMLVRI